MLRRIDATARRFWTKVDIRQDGCWNWQSAMFDRGYGAFRLNGQQHKAHRVAWRLFHQENVPSGKYVLHHCDNPRCVRPSHLFVGTLKDNSQDMVAKGRGIKGADVYTTVLDADRVREIRRLHAGGGYTCVALGKMFGVTGENIGSVVRRRTWKHVED